MLDVVVEKQDKEIHLITANKIKIAFIYIFYSRGCIEPYLNRLLFKLRLLNGVYYGKIIRQILLSNCLFIYLPVNKILARVDVIK